MVSLGNFWPGGKKFAFTIFDDPDWCNCETRQMVYPFLDDLGFRTTRAVWPTDLSRPSRFGGETCSNPEYLADALRFQKKGFEIAYHNAAPHSSTREEIIQSLETFRSYFSDYPSSMANHTGNADAIYWGSSRLTGIRRPIYDVLNLGRTRNCFKGHLEDSPYFWGDICRERIRYCRNFVFYRDVNTLRACPWMPYSDPLRPYVREWFSGADGTDCRTFVRAISEKRQDQLEAEGGLCILYTHFGKYFVQDGKLDGEFVRLMKRLAGKNAWFAPVSTILDFLKQKNGERVITAKQRGELEWKWLSEKIFRGRT
jgi:hypothetical protein